MAAATLSLPAKSVRTSGDGALASVTAESHYGTATVTAPVRSIGGNRREVRLPGGTWVDCHLSCRETLRRETVDFWQSHGGKPGDGEDGPGFFRWSH